MKEFMKKYGFYMAVSVISVGAIAAVFLMSGKEGNVANEANPYAANEETAGRVLDELDDNTKSFILDPDQMQEEVNVAESKEKATDKKVADSKASDNKVTDNKQADGKGVIATQVGEVSSETFSSTTVTKEEPFFAEGDTFLWPIKESAVTVPYTDNNTGHWFSESLDQTIRTNGICISGTEGEKVVVGAEGTIVELIEDSTTLEDTSLPGNIGKMVKIDHGNGYISTYGLQKGEFAEGLEKGMHIKAGDALGVVGKPAGPFIEAGPNVYMQMTKNEELINPQDLLAYVDSVAMGHDADNE